jgi:hypothetical protein
MNSESNMEHTLRNAAKLLGLFLLAISIYLSYDGFDQGVTGGNTTYSNLAKVIGLVIAVSVGCIQFIFSSRYDQLNTTLKGVGLVSYAYSIWTNYLGAKHLLGMNDMTALATAFFMDIVPEPMIAWSLGDSMKGDVLGNLGKWFTGYQPPRNQPQNNHQNHPRPNQDTQPRHEGGKVSGSEKRKQLEMMRMAQQGGGHHGPDRRDGAGEGQKHKNNHERYNR